MKKHILVPNLIVALLVLLSLACSTAVNNGLKGVKGSGNVVTETRQVSDFDRVVLSGVGELEITQGDVETLEIEAEDNILKLITTEVSGKELRIGIKENAINFQPTQPIRYRLTVKSLVGVSSSGAGSVKMGTMTADDLDIEISGAGSVKIEALQADKFSVLLSGAGSCSVAGGEVKHMKIEVSGAGSLTATELKVAGADVEISGLGSARLWVTETLDVQISGTGSVEYYGQPAVTESVMGLGSVKRLGDK